MYFFSFSLKAAAFRCKGKKSCMRLRKNVQVFTILSSPTTPPSCTGPWNATPVLSSHSSGCNQSLNWSRGLTWFKKQSEHSPQLSLFFFFPGQVTLKLDHFPSPQLLETLARESDRNLLSTKTIKFAEKLLSSSLPRGDVLINGSLLASAV